MNDLDYDFVVPMPKEHWYNKTITLPWWAVIVAVVGGNVLGHFIAWLVGVSQ